jgi:hypothetical protein
MLLHGDFSSFSTNFALQATRGGSGGLAIWLAQQHFDVWGVDRRWVLTPQVGDLSDFAGMSHEQELDDLQAALSIAEALRGPSRHRGFQPDDPGVMPPREARQLAVTARERLLKYLRSDPLALAPDVRLQLAAAMGMAGGRNRRAVARH